MANPDDVARAKSGDKNLRGADLRGANLSNADLKFATLSGANLEFANLSGAKMPDDWQSVVENY